MDNHVRIGTEGAMGVVTLARPKAINALTPAMIETITTAMTGWSSDPAIRAVLIEGEGEKGFCAGGDVRLTRELVLAGQSEEAFAFFAAEYRLNGLIATYGKPVIALQHGVVMGGGIGLSSHARYRIGTPSSVFAMPEAAIGFFCDVGANAILYQTPRAPALAFLMSARSVNVADAMALGLCDAAIEEVHLGDVRGRLIEAARAGDVDTAISAILSGEAVDPGEAEFTALANSIAPVFAHDNAADIVAHMSQFASDGDPGAAALAATLSALCPTSLEVIVKSHLAARRLRDVTAILAMDLRLARLMAGRPDFAEGVRAVLVDKDRKPGWSPASLDDVDSAAIAAIVGGRPSQ